MHLSRFVGAASAVLLTAALAACSTGSTGGTPAPGTPTGTSTPGTPTGAASAGASDSPSNGAPSTDLPWDGLADAAPTDKMIQLAVDQMLSTYGYSDAHIDGTSVTFTNSAGTASEPRDPVTDCMRADMIMGAVTNEPVSVTFIYPDGQQTCESKADFELPDEILALEGQGDADTCALLTTMADTMGDTAGGNTVSPDDGDRLAEQAGLFQQHRDELPGPLASTLDGLFEQAQQAVSFDDPDIGHVMRSSIWDSDSVQTSYRELTEGIALYCKGL